MTIAISRCMLFMERRAMNAHSSNGGNACQVRCRGTNIDHYSDNFDLRSPEGTNPTLLCAAVAGARPSECFGIKSDAHDDDEGMSCGRLAVRGVALWIYAMDPDCFYGVVGWPSTVDVPRWLPCCPMRPP